VIVTVLDWVDTNATPVTVLASILAVIVSLISIRIAIKANRRSWSADVVAEVRGSTNPLRVHVTNHGPGSAERLRVHVRKGRDGEESKRSLTKYGLLPANPNREIMINTQRAIPSADVPARTRVIWWDARGRRVLVPEHKPPLELRDQTIKELHPRRFSHQTRTRA